MSQYAGKLSLIEKKMVKLRLEEDKLIEKRKNEIGAFAEKFGLLTLSDELIIGVFSDIKKNIETQSEKIKTWEEHGRQLVKPKRDTQKIKENQK